MAEIKELENMVSKFLVVELREVLRVDHQSVSGRKKDLQTRVLELLHKRSIQLTICEIYQAKLKQQVCQQVLSPSVVPSQEELPPTHEMSLPTPTMNPVHQTRYTSVTPQQTTSAAYSSCLHPPKVLPPLLQRQPRSQCPVLPKVRLRKLTFYDVLAELLKPSSLLHQESLRIQEKTFMFHLTPKQSADIARSWDCQVQMRFCLQETSCEQEDCFPLHIAVKVNGNQCLQTFTDILELETLSRPVDISNFIRKSPIVTNYIKVVWLTEYGRRYAVAVYLVRKLSSVQLVSRLKSRGVQHSDYTRGMIKEKLNEDANSEIATTSLRVSLACPLGKTRMVTPCRASTCSHLQCFDALLFLQMNEKTPTWSCPVCDKPALYDTLVIDGYFQDVLNSKKLLPDENTIQLFQDGSWENLTLKKQKDKDATESKVVTNSQDCSVDLDTTVDLDESNLTPPEEKERIDIIDLSTTTESISNTSHSPECIIIDLD